MGRNKRKIVPAEFNDLNLYVYSYVEPMQDTYGPEVLIEFQILTKRFPVSGQKEFAPGLWADITGRTPSGHLQATCTAGAFLEAVHDWRILHRDTQTGETSPYPGHTAFHEMRSLEAVEMAMQNP